ncbi:MAG: ArsA family ATPase [Bdellovibrionota bacterium]
MQGQAAVPWSDKKIVFVSGKGGVGKSLVAAGLARELARSGRKTLLAEIGETSYYQDFWGLPRVGHVPTRTADGFDLALWSGETSLREYVLFYLKMERLYSLFFENKVMRALVNVAPGLAEIAILGKVTSGLRKVGPPLDYDTIVVDSYATGHALALFQAPKGMKEAIGFGPMGHHSREIDEILRDPKLTAYVVVTLLEELPVSETLEFRLALEKELGILADVVANKVVEFPVSRNEIEEIASANRGGLGEFSDYLRAIDKRQEKYLDQLTKSGVGLRKVPLVFSADPNVLVEKAGEALRKT